MSNPAQETVEPPYTAFRFEVILDLDEPPPGVTNPVCNASFAECDGLDMSLEPKTVREGGNNQEQIHLKGPVSYSQLTLRRGMTANLHLWNWFEAAAQPGKVPTAQGQVIMLDAAGTPRIIFLLRNCMPARMRGPTLNARDGLIAIEEMQLVYDRLEVRPAGGGGLSFGVSLGVSVGASVSGGVNLSGSFSASASAKLGIG